MPHQDQDSVNGDLHYTALVVCVGNELIADDAIGYEVYTRLQAMDLPSYIRIEFAGIGGVALLEYLTGNERTMIVVDAVQLGAPAGTIHCIPWDTLPSCAGTAISAHGIGLKETIDIGKILYPERIPRAITLVGIEGRCFNRMRDAMTPATAAVAEDAAEFIRKQLNIYLEEH